AYTLDAQARVVHIVQTGNPSFQDWSGMMGAIFQDPRYAPGWNLLSDRGAVSQPQTREFIEAVAAFLRRNSNQLENGRWAMVVNGLAVYGMARMAQEMAGDLPVKLGVFTDMGEARE